MRISSLLFLITFISVSTVFAQQGEAYPLKQSLEQAPDDSSRIMLLLDRANRLKNSGEITESMKILGKARNLSESTEDVHLIQSVSLQYADNYLTGSQPDSAVTVLQQSLRRFPDTGKKAEMLNLLATAYRYQAKYQEALKVYNEAKSVVDSTESPGMAGRINLNMAVVYENIGDMGRAFRYHLEGLEAIKASGDSVNLATALNNIGDAYNQNSEPEKAGYYLEQAIRVSEQIDYKVGLLRSLINLANTKKDLGEFETALDLYNRALKLHGSIRQETPPVRITYNLGDLYLKMGEDKRAEKYFLESLNYCEQLGIAEGLYYNNIGLGELSMGRGSTNDAIKYFEKALTVGNELDAAPFVGQANKKLYQLYKSVNQFQAALNYFETYKAIDDSLDHIADEQKLSENETRLNLIKEEETNRLLQARQQAQESRITVQNWLIGSATVIIIGVIFLLILLYRSNSEKRRINEELEIRRSQLENLNQVKDKMLAIIAHDLRSPLASVQGMLYLFRENDLSKEEITSMSGDLEAAITQNISMMDNLLVWARDQMSGQNLNIGKVNAREVTEEILVDYQFQAQHKGIKMVNNITENLYVKADYNLFKLILRNLITNSIKFSGSGDEITVYSREEKDEAVFVVEDTGVGIPEERQKDLFLKEGKSSSGTNDEKGSGLGLRLCKEFVEKQNGSISIESSERTGTRIYFSLPVDK